MNIASRPPLRRLLALDGLLRANRYPNARTAGAALEVHPRTIHRDLDFLRDSWGAPLEFSRKHNGYYYRDLGYPLPLLRLSEGELLALFLAERVMQQYQTSCNIGWIDTGRRSNETKQRRRGTRRLFGPSTRPSSALPSARAQAAPMKPGPCRKS